TAGGGLDHGAGHGLSIGKGQVDPFARTAKRGQAVHALIDQVAAETLQLARVDGFIRMQRRDQIGDDAAETGLFPVCAHASSGRVVTVQDTPVNRGRTRDVHAAAAATARRIPNPAYNMRISISDTRIRTITHASTA